MSAIAIDLGGTHIRFGVVQAEGHIYNVTRELLPPYADRDVSTIWDYIVDRIVMYCAQCNLPASAPIVFAFPGPIIENRFIAAAPTVSGGTLLDGDRLALRIEAETRRRVTMLNDVSAAAWFFGRHGQADNGIVVTVSSGIGAKIFDRGRRRWVHDKNPFAGEIGHVKVDGAVGAPRCDCGELGHLGALASGRGTERRARTVAAIDYAAYSSSFIYREFAAEPASIENERHLVPATLAGDAWACAIVHSGIDRLSAVLAIITAANALSSIIIMGGFALALGDFYTRRLQLQIDELLSGMLGNIVVVTSAAAFGCDWPALYGCGIYAREIGIV